jgi:cell division inhibitor SepF
MASMWRRAMVYLGLQDDDEYDQYDQYDYEDEGREPDGRAHDHRGAREPREQHREPAAEKAGSGSVRALARADTGPTVSSQPPVIRTVPTNAARVHVVEPHGFNDAQEVGDRLKENQPVILNLQGLGRELQRRLIDFSSGLAYAVGGSMSRVADQVFLLTPTNVEVSEEEKERLQARGLYRT